MIVSQSRPEEARAMLPALLAVARRRKFVLTVPVLGGLAIGLLSYSNAPQTYVSEAVLAFDARRIQVLPTESVVSPLPQDSPVLRTELDLISSRLMAGKVIDRLEADGVEIRNDASGKGLPAVVLESAFGLFQASADPSGVPRAVSDEKRVKIDRLLSRLSVNNDGHSYTIFIAFRASDPVYAAKVANAYAATYLDHHIAVKRTATRRISDWLGETLVSLRANLEASEKAAEDFRRQSGLVMTEGGTLQDQRIAALNAELVATRAALAGVHARLETVKALAEEDEIPAAADILGSATIQNLRADQVRLERRIEELRANGATKNTQLEMLASELATLKQQIHREVQNVVESLSNEIAIARRKEASLEDALVAAKGELAEANHAEVQLAQFEREAAVNRSIYESYLVRYKQTIEQDGIAAPEAQVISLAEPATARVSPQLSTWMLFGLAFGGSIGLAGAVFREATDRRVHLSQALETSTEVPVVGYVPRLSVLERKRIATDAIRPCSRFGRAISALRLMLGVSPRPGSTLTVAVTSALPGDGKTTLTVGIAHAAVAAGVKTVIVDANFYNPSVEKALKVSATAYIDEVPSVWLPSEAVQVDPKSGLHFVAAREDGVGSFDEFLASGGLKKLISALKGRFDLILIDMPDLEHAAEVAQIVPVADRLVFVAPFSGKQLHQTIASIQNLASCARMPDGIVLNRVDQGFYTELAERPPRPAEYPAPANTTSQPPSPGIA